MDAWVDAGREGIEATCVAADREGVVWVGNRNPGLHRISGNQWQWGRTAGLMGNCVRSILAAIPCARIGCAAVKARASGGRGGWHLPQRAVAGVPYLILTSNPNHEDARP